MKLKEVLFNKDKFFDTDVRPDKILLDRNDWIGGESLQEVSTGTSGVYIMSSAFETTLGSRCDGSCLEPSLVPSMMAISPFLACAFLNCDEYIPKTPTMRCLSNCPCMDWKRDNHFWKLGRGTSKGRVCVQRLVGMIEFFAVFIAALLDPHVDIASHYYHHLSVSQKGLCNIFLDAASKNDCAWARDPTGPQKTVPLIFSSVYHRIETKELLWNVERACMQEITVTLTANTHVKRA